MIEAQIDRKVEPLVWERDAEIKSWLFSTDGEWMISRHGHMGFWLSRRDHDYSLRISDRQRKRPIPDSQVQYADPLG